MAPCHSRCWRWCQWDDGWLATSNLDEILRPLPILTAVPCVALYTADIRRVSLNPVYPAPPGAWLSGWDGAAALDAVCLSFVGLSIAWSLNWMIVLRYAKVNQCFVALVDFAFWVMLLGTGQTTLSMRSHKDQCAKYINACALDTINMMRAAGALMITTA